MQFAYNQYSSRVVFGVGTLKRLGEEAERIGVKRALVLCTPGQKELAAKAVAELGPCAAGVYPRAMMHVPKEIALDASEEVRRCRADCTVAIGGGSTIGLAKAVSLETGLPSIAVPTTYAGSEMTTIYGLTEHGLKVTGRDARVLPKVTIYDSFLTLSVPPKVVGPSGMNAIAHCVEALYAPDANPVTSLLAEEAIRSLTKYLPIVVREPQNLEARSGALYGAWLAGSALGAVAMGLHHKLCHTLGGAFNRPHAETHAVLLPDVVRYNTGYAKEVIARLSRALGEPDSASGLVKLAKAVGAPTSLKSIGLQENLLDRAADLAVKNPYYNPRPVERNGIRLLLENAYHGVLSDP
jgi:maleylacetate reductase